MSLKTSYFYFWRYQDALTIQEKSQIMLGYIVFETQSSEKGWKGRAPNNADDPSDNILRILNMKTISIKMKWEFGNMGSLNL